MFVLKSTGSKSDGSSRCSSKQELPESCSKIYIQAGRLTALLYMSRPARLASVILMVMQNRHMHEGIAHTAQGMTLAGRVLIGLWTDLLAERVSQCTKDMIRGSNN